MAIRWTEEVWGLGRHGGGKLLVLLALADFANNDGEAWPSIDSLAEKVRLSPRHVQRLLRELEEDGEIEAVGGHAAGRSNTTTYRFLLPKGDAGVTVSAASAEREKVTSATEKVTPASEKGDARVTRSVMNQEQPRTSSETFAEVVQIAWLGESPPSNTSWASERDIYNRLVREIGHEPLVTYVRDRRIQLDGKPFSLKLANSDREGLREIAHRISKRKLAAATADSGGGRIGELLEGLPL